MKIVIHSDQCPRDHVCSAIASCPVGAILQKDIYSAPVIDEQLCTECGECVKVCNRGTFVFEGEGPV